MELKFVATTRPQKPSSTFKRRQKLVRRIDQQIGYVRQMINGQQPLAAGAVHPITSRSVPIAAVPS